MTTPPQYPQYPPPGAPPPLSGSAPVRKRPHTSLVVGVLVLVFILVGIVIVGALVAPFTPRPDSSLLWPVNTAPLTAPLDPPDAVSPSAPTSAPPGTASVTPVPGADPVDLFGPGTYLVGTDIQSGTYRTTGPSHSGGSCYWSRLTDTSGDVDTTITDGSGQGPTTVTIKESDRAFSTSGCTQWEKVD